MSEAVTSGNVDIVLGCRLGAYSCRATLLQFFVVGEGIDKSKSHFFRFDEYVRLNRDFGYSYCRNYAHFYF